MVHSLPMAGGSHQTALTAAPLSHRRIDQGRETHEGKRKREIMRKGQIEVENRRERKEIIGERGGKCGEEYRGRDIV